MTATTEPAVNPDAADLAQLLAELYAEVQRQDRIHPAGYPATRDGLRLGIAALEDEVMEVHGEWHANRRTEGWGGLDTELLQVAAVAVRMVRSIREDSRWTN